MANSEPSTAVSLALTCHKLHKLVYATVRMPLKDICFLDDRVPVYRTRYRDRDDPIIDPTRIPGTVVQMHAARLTMMLSLLPWFIEAGYTHLCRTCCQYRRRAFHFMIDHEPAGDIVASDGRDCPRCSDQCERLWGFGDPDGPASPLDPNDANYCTALVTSWRLCFARLLGSPLQLRKLLHWTTVEHVYATQRSSWSTLRPGPYPYLARSPEARFTEIWRHLRAFRRAMFAPYWGLGYDQGASEPWDWEKALKDWPLR